MSIETQLAIANGCVAVLNVADALQQTDNVPAAKCAVGALAWFGSMVYWLYRGHVENVGGNFDNCNCDGCKGGCKHGKAQE